MTYLVVKALHIFFATTWFAGLIYIFRMFVYHADASSKNEPARTVLMEQFGAMEKRLWYIITWPSCIGTLVFGTWMLVLQPNTLSMPWMYLKLFFVVLLVMYQFLGQRILHRLSTEPSRVSSFRLSVWSQASVLILAAITFLVVMKDALSWWWGMLGVVGLIVLIGIGMTGKRKSGAVNSADSKK